MTTHVKTVLARARIAPPESESLSEQDAVRRWREKTCGIERTKEMVRLYKDGFLEKDVFFLSIKDMSMCGKIIDPGYITKFQGHILRNELIDIAGWWKDDCIEIISYLYNSYSTLNKLIKKGRKRGYFVFNENIYYKSCQFAKILEILGLATLSNTANGNKCRLKNEDGIYNCMYIFDEVIKRNGPTPSLITSNLTESGSIPNTMIKIETHDNYGPTYHTKNNSDNKTTNGDNSPIAKVASIKNKNVKKTSQTKSTNWFKENIFEILKILVVVAFFGWALYRGRSLIEILDSRAGITPTVIPSITTNPTKLN